MVLKRGNFVWFNFIWLSVLSIWNIIDDTWDRMLHRSLHAATYYLNPQLHYGPGFKADICITRMVEDPEEQAKIEVQMHDFKKQICCFGTRLAKLTLDKSTPANWWDSAGFEYPEHQRFAI